MPPHPRPLIYRSGEGRWRILDHKLADAAQSAMNLPLGIDEEATYDQFTVPLETGDFVLVYTDALTEAKGDSGRMLGEEGLLAILGGLDLAEPSRLGPALLDAIREYRGGEPADDDVTILILHHNGRPPRHPSIGEKLDVYAKVFGLKQV